jgi:ribosomal protein S18 acetylase RimI-like enzyme
MLNYKIDFECIDWSQLVALYAQVGLVGGKGEQGDREAIKSAFSNSSKVVTVWDGDRLVGAGRMLSDGVCYATIFDIGVIPEYRRKGIATGIMNELLKGCEGISVHLTSRFGVESLYKKLGFRKHKNAYARYPHQSEYLEEE